MKQPIVSIVSNKDPTRCGCPCQMNVIGRVRRMNVTSEDDIVPQSEQHQSELPIDVFVEVEQHHHNTFGLSSCRLGRATPGTSDDTNALTRRER